jgi:hypothetical protein
MKKINGLVLSTLTAALLIGCGGGGSSDSGATTQSNIAYGGAVIDGYIKNATVCLDLSLDGVCDNSEPSTKTDDNGAYSLVVTPTQQNHQNFSIAPVIAFGGTDIDTGDDFTGKLQAQVSGTTANVTPLTTILSKLVQKEVSSSTSKTELENKIKNKKEEVRTSFGLPEGTNIEDDFLKSENNDLNKIALKIQKTVDFISNIGSDGSVDKDKLSDEIFKTLITQIGQSGDILDNTINEITTNTTISGLVFDDASKKEKLELAKNNLDVIIENSDSVEDMVSLIEDQKNKIELGEELEEYNKDTLPSEEQLKLLALQNFLRILEIDISVASSLIEDGITKNNIISDFSDSTKTELHTKYPLVKTAIETYLKKLDDDKKTKSYAVQAIEILEKMNIETDNVDTKIDEAKTKVKGLTQNDAVMVQNMLDLTKIINSDEVSNILEIEASSLSETSTIGKIVKSTVDDSIVLSEKYNGIASNSVIVINKMATQLKTISDSIAKVFENKDYVFTYGNEKINYNDSLALRGSILAVAFKLDFIASYSWGSDEDIKTEEKTIDSVSYEYENISIDPASVLNKGAMFKLSNGARLDGARAYLIEGLELANKLPIGYEDTIQDDKTELQNILNSLKGNGSYELVEEWEEFSWDYEKWQQDNSYTGDRTTYTEKYYVDLSKLLNSNTAIDVTSFGSDFDMACERAEMSYNVNVSKIQNAAECTYADYINSNESYVDSAFIKPKVKPTVANSKLDDVVTQIIDIDGNELTGQELIDFLIKDQEEAK